MAKGIACEICGKLIPAKQKSTPGPQKRRHDACADRAYRKSPLGRVRYANELIRRKAKHASKNLRPHQKVTDEQFKLPNRKKHGGLDRWVRPRQCGCGERYYAGNKATRCWKCEVDHRRQMHRKYYVERVQSRRRKSGT